MKIIVVVMLLGSLILHACVDSTVEPEGSIGGEMTATMNGKRWVSQRAATARHSTNEQFVLPNGDTLVFAREGRLYLLLGGRYRNQSDHNQISFYLNDIYSAGTYKLGKIDHTTPGSCFASFQDNSQGGRSFITQADTPGEITITKWNTDLIEGNFMFIATRGKEPSDTIRVEDGKFRIFLNQ